MIKPVQGKYTFSIMDLNIDVYRKGQHVSSPPPKKNNIDIPLKDRKNAF